MKLLKLFAFHQRLQNPGCHKLASHTQVQICPNLVEEDIWLKVIPQAMAIFKSVPPALDFSEILIRVE